MSGRPIRVLVTGAGGSAASNFVDSLRLTDLALEIFGTDYSPEMLSLSRVDSRILLPRSDQPDYEDKLINLCQDKEIDVIWSQPDSELRVVSALRDQLPTTFIPTHEKIIEGADKEAVLLRLRKADVSVPLSWSGEHEELYVAKCEEFLEHTSSLWIRARRGAGSRASLPVRTPRQAVNWINWWIEEKGLHWSDFQVAEQLPGREFAFQSIWANGEVISAEARQRLSYLYGFLSPSGQSSTPAIAVSTRDSLVLNQGLNSVRAFDPNPHGVYCVDMKEDVNGVLKTTEINVGRFFTTMNFFAHAGINMPAMALRGALGYELEPQGIGTIPEELYWVRMVDMGFKLLKREELEALVEV